MSIKHVTRRFWRSSLVIGSLAAIAMALPASASALTPQYCAPLHWTASSTCSAHHPRTGETGWGFIDELAPACPNDGTVGCGTYTPEVTAWRWNGAWQRTTLGGASQVYVYPFATGWSWVWTSRTGWLAVQDRYVWLRG
jgi:hypothetical protein